MPHPPGMELHVYRLTDDEVPVVVISMGPLPPPRRWDPRSIRELIGVYATMEEAHEAAMKARTSRLRRIDAGA